MNTIFPETEARLAEWVRRPEVLGVILVGSKAVAHSDALSDDDLEILLTEEAFDSLAPAGCHELRLENEGAQARIIYDALYTTLTELKKKTTSPRDLDHWPYETARVLFARDPRVREAVEAAARMTGKFRRTRLMHATIDAWAASRRAAKTVKRGHEAAARLVLACGAKALSRVMFALEWRWVPLDHWLEAELETLDDRAGARTHLLEAIKTCNPAELAAGLDRLEEALYAEGVARPDGRIALFLELVHASRADERLAHGLF